MLEDRIQKAIAALRAAGHTVEPVPSSDGEYRVDGKDPVPGGRIIMIAIYLGLMDKPPGGR